MGLPPQLGGLGPHRASLLPTRAGTRSIAPPRQPAPEPKVLLICSTSMSGDKPSAGGIR